jgi:hypothetical protein
MTAPERFAESQIPLHRGRKSGWPSDTRFTHPLHSSAEPSGRYGGSQALLR